MKDERGAVLAIVALSLIALMGMVILVIDVGGLLVMKRRLVTTSDSAALAAAQQCAQNKGQTAATTEANEVAAGNVDTSLGKIAFTPSCTASNGEATARYRAGQRLFFAPILGLGDDMTVSAPATAIWGPAGSGITVPLMVSGIQIRDDCIGLPPPPDVEIGTQCGFWYDRDSIGSANWGWMNLDDWGVGKGDHCGIVGTSQHEEWIEGNFPDPLALNWPNATYVCADTGQREANWKDIRAIIGQIRVFPVNDPDGQASIELGAPAGTEHGQVDRNGNRCPPGSPCTLDKYDIIGFTVFKIVDLFDGNTEEAVGKPGLDPIPDSSGTCDDKTNLNKNDSFAIYTLNADGCPKSAFPTTIDPRDPFVYTKQGQTVTTRSRCASLSSTGCDYYFDPILFEIHWLASNTNNVFMHFDWFKQGTTGFPGSEGACGEDGKPPLPDTEAKNVDSCLVVEWRGFQSTGLDPGGGPDLGLRAIRLAE